VVVVSDGADRSGLDPARFARRGVRVRAVARGDDLKDDAIRRVEPADRLLRHGARSHHLAIDRRRRVPVALRRDDRLEREVVAECRQQRGRRQIRSRRRASDARRIRCRSARESRSRRTTTRVPRASRDKLRVLLVARQPSWISASSRVPQRIRRPI
jgi:hypothetical protein